MRHKRWFGAVAVCAVVSGNALADSVPQGIKDWFAASQTKALQLTDGVLSVSFSKPLISDDLWRTQIKSLCAAPLASKKYSWGSARIDRIDLMNDIGAQGYALVGGRKSCEKLVTLEGVEADHYLMRMRREIRAGRVQE